MSGRERNKPCHCGSGQKYKKCHLLIEQHIDSGEVKKIEIHELQKMFNETAYQEICVAQDLNTPKKCTEKIINAHTLTRSLSLEKISKDGHVYAFKNKDLFSFFKSNGVVTLTKVGVRTASTFKGFCSYHDDYLFSSIEKENFSLSREEISALFYRSFALEYYKKKNVLDNARRTFKPLIQNTQKNQFDLSAKLIVSNLKRAKLDFEDNLKIRDKIVSYFNEDSNISIKTFAIKIENGLPVVCTGLFALYKDLSDNVLQDIYDYELAHLEYISLNIFYAKNGSYWMVLNWFESDSLVNGLISELKKLTIVDQINIILNMMLLYTENIYFSVDYIDKLSEKNKKNIERVFNGSFEGNFIPLTQNNFNFYDLNYEVFEQ